MSDKTEIGNRMKNYEDVFRQSLPLKMPLILRIDGKAFSSYTKNFEQPWSEEIKNAFIFSSKMLFPEVQGLKIAYAQSDEMSLLITDYDSLYTKAYCDNNIQKIVSIVSSIITASFNNYISNNTEIKKLAYFDCRAFVLPKDDVNNYFSWRQKDAIKNSISVLAQSVFSDKELHEKKSQEKKDMLAAKGIVWDDLYGWKRVGYTIAKENKTDFKNGKDFIRSVFTENINPPIFFKDKTYIEKYVYLENKV